MDVEGDYFIQLTVTDNWNVKSTPDTVIDSTFNTAPVADAGGSQSVVVGETVFLDGSGSSDANLDPLTYSWSLVSKPEGSAAVLFDPFAVDPSFLADQPGLYGVALVVNDGFVDSVSDSVTIATVSGVDEIVATLRDAITIINGFDDDVFKNRHGHDDKHNHRHHSKAHKRKKALVHKINSVLKKVDKGRYEKARKKLVSSVLRKTDGCAKSAEPESPEPDRNDWIINCLAQKQLYDVLLEAVALLDQAILTNPDPEEDDD